MNGAQAIFFVVFLGLIMAAIYAMGHPAQAIAAVDSIFLVSAFVPAGAVVFAMVFRAVFGHPRLSASLVLVGFGLTAFCLASIRVVGAMFGS